MVTTSDAALADAARAGDPDALDTLVRRHMEALDALVRQALEPDPDVDDVVQEVLLQVLQNLPRLPASGDFGRWLAAVARSQIDLRRSLAEVAGRHRAPLDAAAGETDPSPEGPALLRAELATQRRRARHASRWLSGEDRALLRLWWQEEAGALTRAEVASAVGVNGANAAVRLQRIRIRFQVSRSIVAALEAMPGCDELGEVVADWDGVPSPFWRKRIARHIPFCAVCQQAADGMIPAEGFARIHGAADLYNGNLVTGMRL